MRLSIRLRETDDKIVEERSPASEGRDAGRSDGTVGDVRSRAGVQLSIGASTAALQELIGAEAIRIETLPFVVGRALSQVNPNRGGVLTS